MFRIFHMKNLRSKGSPDGKGKTEKGCPGGDSRPGFALIKYLPLREEEYPPKI